MIRLRYGSSPIPPVSYTHLDVYKRQDKLRPGGVMALITSKGTMDKENSAVRKYIAQRADLLGACLLYTSRCV